MRTLTALIIAVLYIFTAARAKTFLDQTVCDIQFVKDTQFYAAPACCRCPSSARK